MLTAQLPRLFIFQVIAEALLSLSALRIRQVHRVRPGKQRPWPGTSCSCWSSSSFSLWRTAAFSWIQPKSQQESHSQHFAVTARVEIPSDPRGSMKVGNSSSKTICGVFHSASPNFSNNSHIPSCQICSLTENGHPSESGTSSLEVCFSAFRSFSWPWSSRISCSW